MSWSEKRAAIWVATSQARKAGPPLGAEAVKKAIAALEAVAPHAGSLKPEEVADLFRAWVLLKPKLGVVFFGAPP